MSDLSPRRIEFRLEGSRKDEGLVLAQDFVGFLENALKVLRRLERAQTGEAKKVHLEYRIVEMEIGSALIGLEADAHGEADAAQVLGRFAEGMAAFRDGRFGTLGFDAGTAEAFADMMAPLKHRVRAIHADVGGIEIDVFADTVHTFDLGPDAESELVGSVAGYVDAVNVHKEPVFYLYPTVGPRVSCRFDRRMLDDVRGALKQYTTVYGLLGYAEGSAFPVHAIVERVEVNPPIAALPTLRSLWGIARGMTRGLGAVAHVRQLRDATEE